MMSRISRKADVTRSAVVLLMLPLLAAGCVRRVVSTVDVTPGAMPSEIRSATNLPDQFDVVIPPEVTGGCPQQLRDPGLHTLLRLHRSVMQQVTDSAGASYRTAGDYQVEPRGR